MSAGVDEVPVILVKKIANQIVKPLVHVANLSMAEGVFPEKLKISKVVPLLKKGNKHILMKYNVTHYLNIHIPINSNQHGFQVGRSTETVVLEYTKEIITKLEEGKSVVGINLDLSSCNKDPKSETS
ncbi:uncharacterized protein LOC124716729 [Schistocerca piceifrons]|uniref:uncharacterized protein LOC124716729 n=1 Tax=Schistocerca piceifrons TaxID=274613 RepID=UPI001F5EDA29|nr:uncharacterized protein LOC124716729 [Schistocerca piceifrons]